LALISAGPAQIVAVGSTGSAARADEASSRADASQTTVRRERETRLRARAAPAARS
jgi:hypothetical protein